MTTFDKREEGFEKKFALDEELKFKADARRNKLLGLWAAEKLGLSGDAATAYAREVVAADFDCNRRRGRQSDHRSCGQGRCADRGRASRYHGSVDGGGHRPGESGKVRRVANGE